MLHFIQKQTLRFILLLLLIVAGKDGFGQKEWNNWYFGKHAGLTFNSGSPLALTNGLTNSYKSFATISDSIGNLLFYTNGKSVYNRVHVPMLHGDDLLGTGTQGSLILPLPGNDSLFYIVTVSNLTSNINAIPGNGIFYSVVNMKLNGGLGDVDPLQKNIPLILPISGYAVDKLTSIRHKNNRDIWIVCRNFPGDKFVSYLLTPSGIDINTVVSDSFFSIQPWEDQNSGEIAISPDGKKMAVAYDNIFHTFEYGSFDISTGQYSKLFSVIPTPVEGYLAPIGLEFSPNSKLLYCCFSDGALNYYRDPLYQYDATLSDSALFNQSEIRVGTGVGNVLQTGPDGKIYGGLTEDTKMSVINEPDKRGIFCNFQYGSLSLESGKSGIALPQKIEKYYARFSFQVACLGMPVQFTSNVWPIPDSVVWNFDDAQAGILNTSHEFNPNHVFNQTGSYSVSLIVFWPGDRSDTVLRTIEILPQPQPTLGVDREICPNGSISLQAETFESYLWSTGDTTRNIIVTDTGSFWVRVINEQGCIGYDTIIVQYYPKPTLDETQLNIAPTTCGKTNGAITGLQVIGQPPFTFQWTATGTPVSDSLDIYHLGTGLYELHVTDGFGCTNIVASYAISDAGNILIDTASVTPAYCGNVDGTLSVVAVSGLGSMLQYFIKTGNDTLSQWSNGNFTGLAGGNYYVWVTDSSGCSSVYAHVLQIDALTAPEILTATSTPETGSAANGTITVNALGNGLTYSLNGATPVNAGHFTGLSAGSYSVTVSNPAGCDTTLNITVEHETGIVLSAIAGNGFACLGKEAKAPIVVRNFKDVQSFETILNYDPLFVTCLGFNNPHPLFGGSLEVTLPASGKILTRWKGTTPLTLPDSTEIVQLVFSSLLPGNALLLWDISPAISNFLGPGGDTLNVDYMLGTILVSNPPHILPEPDQINCEGEFLMVWRTVVNGTGPLSYQWQTPAGPSSQEIIIKTATLADNGLYQLIVTDTLQCADTSTKIVTVVPTPVSGFPTDTDTLYFDERRWLEAAQGYDTYSWNTGDTTNSILVTAEGWYKVTISTPEGCTTTDSVMMLYAFVPLTMPNAFTPDGDLLNDVFRPVTLPEKITSFSMYIYDRWGKQVFFTNDVKQGWDGTINGSPAQVGGYMYVVKYGNPSGAEREKRGMVTVVR